jgi:hypothetical protein
MPSNFKRPTAAVQKQVPGTGRSQRRMGCSGTDDPTGGSGTDPAESLPDKPPRYGRRFVAKNKNTRRSTVLPRGQDRVDFRCWRIWKSPTPRGQ